MNTTRLLIALVFSVSILATAAQAQRPARPALPLPPPPIVVNEVSPR